MQVSETTALFRSIGDVCATDDTSTTKNCRSYALKETGIFTHCIKSLFCYKNLNKIWFKHNEAVILSIPYCWLFLRCQACCASIAKFPPNPP
jgi:hypothetical protein